MHAHCKPHTLSVKHLQATLLRSKAPLSGSSSHNVAPRLTYLQAKKCHNYVSPSGFAICRPGCAVENYANTALPRPQHVTQRPQDTTAPAVACSPYVDVAALDLLHELAARCLPLTPPQPAPCSLHSRRPPTSPHSCSQA